MAKTTKINNRRYLGNKYRLLPFIQRVVEDECEDVNIIVDIFAGTGAVASAFQEKQLVTNDILYSNYISNYAWFSAESYHKDLLEHMIDAYNDWKGKEENYMTQNFANTYFSLEDCAKIGLDRKSVV